MEGWALAGANQGSPRFPPPQVPSHARAPPPRAQMGHLPTQPSIPRLSPMVAPVTMMQPAAPAMMGRMGAIGGLQQGCTVPAGGSSFAEMQQILSKQMATIEAMQKQAVGMTKLPHPSFAPSPAPIESTRAIKRGRSDDLSQSADARPASAPTHFAPLPLGPLPSQPEPSAGRAVSELRPPPPGIDPSVGDWPCACGNWNWARRSQCNKCLAPKGSGSRLMTASVLASAGCNHASEVAGFAGPEGGCGNLSDGEKNLRRKQLLAAAGPSDGSVVPLYMGSMSKPTHYQMSHHNAGPSAGVKAFPPTIDPSVGDWLCTCGNWNWAKRHECNMCRGSKEAANVGAKRTGAAGGFIEYDQSEDQRRKMRAFEAAQQVQARKAEKKKCEYCKRFSCIC